MVQVAEAEPVLPDAVFDFVRLAPLAVVVKDAEHPLVKSLHVNVVVAQDAGVQVPLGTPQLPAVQTAVAEPV